MIIKTKGIVLRSFKYKETSLIVDVYTLDAGLKSFIINGVRKAKSKTSASQFQVMSQIDIVMYDSKKSSLHRMKESRPFVYYETIPFDVVRSLTGQFMIEVIRKSMIDEEPNPYFYFFLVDWFNFLDSTKESFANIIPIFLIKLAAQIGFAFEEMIEGKHQCFDLQEGRFLEELPDHEHYLDEIHGIALNQLMLCNKEHAHMIQISKSVRNQLIDDLLVFFRLHVEGFNEIKSLTILREMFR